MMAGGVRVGWGLVGREGEKMVGVSGLALQLMCRSKAPQWRRSLC